MRAGCIHTGCTIINHERRTFILPETTHPSTIDIVHNTRVRLATGLNRQLCALMDLHSQVKQAHWNIRGRFFYARHELFDEIASHLLRMVDDVAERVGALGFYAEGTMRLAADATYLKPYDHDVSDGQGVIRMLVERFGQVESELRNLIPYTDEQLSDPVTSDLLTSMLRTIEKDHWFLEAHLEGDGTRMPARLQVMPPKELSEATPPMPRDRKVERKRVPATSQVANA